MVTPLILRTTGLASLTRFALYVNSRSVPVSRIVTRTLLLLPNRLDAAFLAAAAGPDLLAYRPPELIF